MSILSLQMMNLSITDVTLDDDLDACWKGTMKIIELHRCHKMMLTQLVSKPSISSGICGKSSKPQPFVGPNCLEFGLRQP